jgi:hypothetical protein
VEKGGNKMSERPTPRTMTNHLINNRGDLIVCVGDEVENGDARFFVGAINESQQLCTLDKSKPFTLKNEASSMANCIRQGNYAASARTLRKLEETK